MQLSLAPGGAKPLALRLRGLAAALRGDGIEARTRRSALLGMAARVVNAGVVLLTHVLLARLLGAAEFGLFSLATTWALVLLGLATLGLTMTPQRFAPEYAASGERGLLAGLRRFAHLAPLAGGAAIAILGWAALRFAPLGLAPELALAVGLALLALPALAVIDVVEGFALAHDWHDLSYGVTFVLKPLLLPALFLAGYWQGADGVQAALGAFALSAWIAAAALVAITARRMRPMVAGAAPAYETRRWFGLALPALLADGAFLTMAYADVLVLSAFASPAETGVYVAATKIVGVVAFVQFGLSYAAAHHFSALHAEARREELALYARKAAFWTFWPSLAAGAAVTLAAGPLLGLFGADFAQGAAVVPLLVAALLARAAIGPSEQLLMMTNRQRSVTTIFAGAALLNVALALTLAPLLGAIGVAIAMLAASLAATLATALAVRRSLGVFVHAFASSSLPSAQPGAGGGLPG